MLAAILGLVGVVLGAGISAIIQWQISRANREQMLATAALDKRLAAHQQAYALWREILRAAHHKSKIGDVVRKAETWWEDNCLYLDAQAREDFRSCMLTVINHSYVVAANNGPGGDAETIEDSWSTVTRPGRSLVEGVRLPSLGEAEKPASNNP